jgi:hypothetical protein
MMEKQRRNLTKEFKLKMVLEEYKDEVSFRKIPVLNGVTDFRFFEITPLGKLEESAEIVVDGVYFLMAQSKKEKGSNDIYCNS